MGKGNSRFFPPHSLHAPMLTKEPEQEQQVLTCQGEVYSQLDYETGSKWIQPRPVPQSGYKWADIYLGKNLPNQGVEPDAAAQLITRVACFQYTINTKN